MTLKIVFAKRKITLKVPAAVVCFFVGKALKSHGVTTFGGKQRRELLTGLRQARNNFGKLTLAEITKKDGHKVVLTL